MKKYKIGVISVGDLSNRNMLSGTSFSIISALEQISTIEIIDNLKPTKKGRLKSLIEHRGFYSRLIVVKAIAAFWKLMGKRYLWPRTHILSKYYASQIERKLEGKNYDFIVSVKGSIELANLKTDIPIIYLSDTTFHLMLNYYDGFFNLSNSSIRQGESIEKQAIEKATLCIYISEWARNSAIKDYKAPEVKAVAIANGPNIEAKYLPEINEKIVKEHPQKCELLLIGVEWKRKGCDIAVETVEKLNKMGIKSDLTICGCNPPIDKKINKYTTIIPFLDKNNEGDVAVLISLYKKATFFIFPTRAEAFGIVLIEACSFGLPIFATDTGGVSEIVKNGGNGYLFSLADGSEKYAEKIAESFQDKKLYRQMSVNSFAQYKTTYNWDKWASSIMKNLEDQRLRETKSF